MTEHEQRVYTDTQAAIDHCVTCFEPTGFHRMLKGTVARSLYGAAGRLDSSLAGVWTMIQLVRQRRKETGGNPQHLPLTPLLELAGRLAWHDKGCFAEDAHQLKGRDFQDEDRCSFLLALADGLRVFSDNDQDRPRPPQNSCAGRAREVLEIWAEWVINSDLIQEAAEQASNWIKQSPSCFGHPLLVAIAERIEAGEFARTSSPKRREALEKLSYAMHKLVLETWRPHGAPVAPPQSLRIIRALAAIAEDDERASAALRS